MIVFVSVFIILLIVGAPISIAIGAGAVCGCFALDYPLMVVGQKMTTGVDSFLLIAVPLFILAGNLMNEGKITEKYLDLQKIWLDGFQAALGMRIL